VRKVIVVGPRTLEKYASTYQLAPTLTSVSRGRATNQRKFEIFPQSTTQFFLKVVDAQTTFVPGASGQATELVLHRGGMNRHAKRLAEPSADQ
jgi:hypothetical protein